MSAHRVCRLRKVLKSAREGGGVLVICVLSSCRAAKCKGQGGAMARAKVGPSAVLKTVGHKSAPLNDSGLCIQNCRD
ncbi:hypothetical protein HOE425_333460 [Hoeflea sp. EC-HK425]|nr:hypothetical protein HOE425_333460 [Hoeflea sp. EC-HK425]